MHDISSCASAVEDAKQDASRSPSPSAITVNTSASTSDVIAAATSAAAQALARAQMSDTRGFAEVLSDLLHAKDGKNVGKLMSDERYNSLVRACGLPHRDESEGRSEREAIQTNKYVAGDGRLFAWKAGREKSDFAAGAWPEDMFEVVRFSDVPTGCSIQQESGFYQLVFCRSICICVSHDG